MISENAQYHDQFVHCLETLWGGFLSPGGVSEVKEILRGIDLVDKSVLDIGCGNGSIELVLAVDLGAGRITAIDVDPRMIERARRRVAEAGVVDRVELQLVQPGPFRYPKDSFDVVFSKESMVHIPDKDGLFREVLRVLRPGVVVAASDWLMGENANTSPEWARFSELTHLCFHFATTREMELAMQKAGFDRVSTVDRNAWCAPITEQEVEQLEGLYVARSSRSRTKKRTNTV